MKILAIRGSNIASLAGAFEVDFERPPLSGAGLFAITGPTGAGKSTLLDVLCLALFGKTPRVSEAGALKVPVTGGGVDGQAITAQDPRNLLRRGAAEGSAEAEFVGVDGRRYRARWEVRRARGKATGNFQKASWTLWRTDGGEETPIADGTTEVEEQVGLALGLTFEQFRKAVLLAQGDFAAFLRAKEKERAELLEKITGAEIYTAVSRKAWERGQEVSDRLKALDERLAALAPMDGEERSRNEGEAAARRNEIGVLDDRRRRLEDAKRKAGDATTREREAHDATERVEAATRARGEKAGAVEREEEGRRKAAEVLDAAREQREARKPELEQARDLDGKLVAKREEAQRSESEAAAARKELATLRAKAADLDEELRVARATEEGAAKWLAAQAADEPLVRQWAACDRSFSLLVRRRDEIGTEGRKTTDAARLADEAAARVVRVEGRKATAATALDAADAAVGTAEEAAKEIDRGAVAAETVRVSGEIEVLAALGQIAGTMSKSVVRRDEAVTAARVAREDAEKADAAADAAERAAGEASKRVAALTEERDSALAVRDLAQLRSALVPGEPCQLCGSKEHPWAGPGEAPADRTRELATLLAAEAESVRKATSEGAGQRAEALGARKRAKEADAAAGKAAAELSGLEREWKEKAALLPGDGTPVGAPPAPAELPEAAERLAASLGAARARREELSRREARAVELEKQLGKARQAREGAVKAAEKATKELHEAEKDLEAARQSQVVSKTRLEGLEREARVLVEELERFTGDDAEAVGLLAADPARLAARWSERVVAFLAREKERDTAGAQIRRLAPMAAAENANCDRAGLALAEKESRSADLAAAVAGLTETRQGLLEGRPVRDVTEALEAAVKEAERELEKAATRLASAVAQRERAVAAVGAAEEDQARAAERAEAARTERDAALAALELPSAAEGAEAAIAVATVEVAKHRAQAEDVLRKVDAALLADDRTRDDRLRAEEERGRTERDGQVWLALRVLIGEASGGKFRKFAQGLTLEALVKSANLHLAEFARRYRLMQAPGTEVGLLVVDCDMGDEVRSVESLSGGESFLVSLALALGLASLATRRSSIGSLFIDEGFGSLDADTLDRAVTALDALQAHGRRIGVISHVQGLAEKIGVQVKVVARGGGRSEVRVVGA